MLDPPSAIITKSFRVQRAKCLRKQVWKILCEEVCGFADYRSLFRFKKFKIIDQYGGQVNLINFYKRVQRAKCFRTQVEPSYLQNPCRAVLLKFGKFC